MFTVRSILHVVAVPVILSLPLLGCPGGGDAGEDGGPPSGTVAISDFELRTDLGEAFEPPEEGQVDPDFCPLPKPDDIGCGQLCKPCVTHRCQDGEWVRHEVTFPEGLCPTGVSVDTVQVRTCPRDPETLVCPAECAVCI